MAQTFTEDDLLTLTGKDITYWNAQKLWREYHREHIAPLQAESEALSHRIWVMNGTGQSRSQAKKDLRERVSELDERLEALKDAGPMNPDPDPDEE